MILLAMQTDIIIQKMKLAAAFINALLSKSIIKVFLYI